MIFEEFLGRYPYLLTVVLLVVGLWGMAAKGNLMKKVIGMTIFQTAILLFYIQGAAKWDATVPVLAAELGTDPDAYVNPLPHVIVLTAIVVGVAITGVALSLLLVIHRRFGSLEESSILGGADEWK